MTLDTVQRRVSLVVTNPQRLRLGAQPRHNFDQDGGFVGSIDADWLLADGRGGVQPRHCEVLWEDGAFCLIDRCGQTQINDSPDALGLDVSVRLSEGDRLRIGPFSVIVHLEQGDHNLPDPRRHLAEHSIDELLNAKEIGLDRLPALPSEGVEPALAAEPAEPLALIRALDQPELDPLKAMDAADSRFATHATDSPLDPKHYGKSDAMTPPDLAQTRFEAVTGSPHHSSGDFRMSSQEPVLGSASIPFGHGNPLADGSDPAQAVAPLLEGLGITVSGLDAQSGYRLLYEAGQSLGALIQGMLALHQQQTAGESSLGLQGRTLQPIEDNPLRLGLSYEETVQALFSSRRSLVHLAPKAAIDESLAQLHRHHDAIVQGIAAGLDALLQAFDPVQLLERFRRYQPEQAAGSAQTDWAWHMYAHYFGELKSDRQRGFSKLFWEVFEQHYDRALRTEA
ncbi:TPA: type VI secretion system-associated FHA domain protein TagH [Pseudomonas aeruginosa]|nr:type VI secretion system-associated FHA domain protein TagH [Pseudomonas aeruginosa]